MIFLVLSLSLNVVDKFLTAHAETQPTSDSLLNSHDKKANWNFKRQKPKMLLAFIFNSNPCNLLNKIVLFGKKNTAKMFVIV